MLRCCMIREEEGIMLRRATPASERVALGRTWSNTWPVRDDGIKGKRASATPDINMRAVEGDFATGVATVAAGCRCSWRLCFAAARCFARPPYPLPSPAPTSPPASQCVCTVHVPPTQPVHPVTTTQLSFSRAVLSAMIAPHPTKRSRNEFIVLIRLCFSLLLANNHPMLRAALTRVSSATRAIGIRAASSAADPAQGVRVRDDAAKSCRVCVGVCICSRRGKWGLC